MNQQNKQAKKIRNSDSDYKAEDEGSASDNSSWRKYKKATFNLKLTKKRNNLKCHQIIRPHRYPLALRAQAHSGSVLRAYPYGGCGGNLLKLLVYAGQGAHSYRWLTYQSSPLCEAEAHQGYSKTARHCHS